MITDSQLANWTGPSSDSEQVKQDRTETMIKDAIATHEAFDGYKFFVYAKGSYANNTNVKADSDVDIVVECSDVIYWDETSPDKGGHPASEPYDGIWTPELLRAEIKKALEKKFPEGSVTPGTTAFEIKASSARVNADVVPCFTLREYYPNGTYRSGTRVFKSTGGWTDNYPKLQLDRGKEKNRRTGGKYKQAVRVLKRLENLLVEAGVAEEVPSYLVECLVYNCNERYFASSSWRDIMQNCLADIFNYANQPEPTDEQERWLEANDVKFLYHPAQKWKRQDVVIFADAAWKAMGFA